jgi:hypothetical protein
VRGIEPYLDFEGIPLMTKLRGLGERHEGLRSGM